MFRFEHTSEHWYFHLTHKKIGERPNVCLTIDRFGIANKFVNISVS